MPGRSYSRHLGASFEAETRRCSMRMQSVKSPARSTSVPADLRSAHGLPDPYHHGDAEVTEQRVRPRQVTSGDLSPKLRAPHSTRSPRDAASRPYPAPTVETSCLKRCNESGTLFGHRSASRMGIERPVTCHKWIYLGPFRLGIDCGT